MKKVKRLFAIAIMLAMVVSNLAGSTIVKAETFINTATAINFVGSVGDIIGIPGETIHVKLPVRAVGAYIQNPKILINTENMPYSVSSIKYTQEGQQEPLGISNANTTYIEFELKVKETAKISRNKLDVTVEFMGISAEDYQEKPVSLKLPNIYVIIEKEKEAAQLTIDNILLNNAVKGSDTDLSFVIKNEGEITSHNTYFSVEGFETAGIIPRYSKMTQEAGKDGKLAANDSYRVKLPVTIASNATAGTKTLTIKMDYKNQEGEVYTSSSKIYVNIEDNSLAPKVEIESAKYASELKAGDTFNLVTTLRNNGESVANNIEISVDGLGITSFIPNYTSEKLDGGSLSFDDKVDIKIPLIVSKEATGGLKKLDLKVTYTDDGGVVYTTTTALYLEVTAAEGMTAEGKPNIVVTGVSQSPNIPNAGARVDISFDLENKSKVDISEIKIGVTNLSANNFSPVNLEPYQYIEKLAGGRKARITIPLTVSENIPEGMSNLELKYEYKDASGKEWSDTAVLYVLDIENSASASKPKLMISNFSTDIEELRAGSVFNFNFDIKNTHSHIDAKNIKVTVNQAENIFTVTKGSNTLYITNIKAGEAAENTLELKVKSDAVTKAYPIEITIEYEYDGAEVNPATGEVGETVKETINLQAIENSRPVVDNIFVGNWDMPIVNQPTALTFEFYNMGKSQLNNVYATIEGDFYISTGSMYFIGNVQSGYSEFAELEVIPTVEGMAKGTLVITFEDSNGDEVKVTKDFESNVQGEFIPDYGPGGDMGGDLGPIEAPAKEPILQVWLFVVIQLVILAVMIPVTRKVVLAMYRRKLRKKEETE